jgi:hypothetical protein
MLCAIYARCSHVHIGVYTSLVSRSVMVLHRILAPGPASDAQRTEHWSR